jgi:hypothetical protein
MILARVLLAIDAFCCQRILAPLLLFVLIFSYVIQQCFICRLSDSTVSEDAGIEPRTVATLAMAVRHSSHSARSHLPLLVKYSIIRN